MTWKAVALIAITTQVVTLGYLLSLRGRANTTAARAFNAVDLMVNCTDSCVEILDTDELEIEEKLTRLSEQFQFVQLAIHENPMKKEKS